MSNLHPNTILFARGTLARLTLWPALRLAVHASWGGTESAQKQRWLAGVLVDQFEPFIVVGSSPTPTPTPTPMPTQTPRDPPPDNAYVEDLLLQIMADEFEVALEDDSAAAVARDIVRLFESTRTGDDGFVKVLEEQAERVKGKVPTYERGGDEDESGSSEGEWGDEDETGSDGESVPQLLNHSEPQTREEPQVDEDGFTMVKRKERR